MDLDICFCFKGLNFGDEVFDDEVTARGSVYDFLVEVLGRAHRAFGRIIDQALIIRELIEKLVLVFRHIG